LAIRHPIRIFLLHEAIPPRRKEIYTAARYYWAIFFLLLEGERTALSDPASKHAGLDEDVARPCG